jgi:hypothetical protein
MINISARSHDGGMFAALTQTSAAVRLIVINASSKAIAAGGRWAVKDENTGTVREVLFGRIDRGQTQEQTVYLPSGVEWGIFDFKAEDGSGSWTAPHGGNNTELYRLTLGD